MSVVSPVVDVWDGFNRRIYLKQGVTTFHWIDDIYKEYRNQRRLDENLRKFEPLLSASGNEAKGQGKSTPRLLTLLTDPRNITTKVVPFDESGELQVNGEAITDIADIDDNLFDISTITSALVINYEPPSAEVIVIDNITKRLDYGGEIFYDPTSIYSGQEHPSGTSAEPVNNEADVIALSQLYNITKVNIRNGTFTVPQNMQSWIFDGSGGQPIVNANNLDISGSRLIGLELQGDLINTNSSIRVFDSIINCTNFSGKANDSGLELFITLKAGIVNFVNCYSNVPGENKPFLDFQGNNIMGRMSNYSGGIGISNISNSFSNFSIDADPASIELDNTNTDGNIRIRGQYDLIDNSNGTDVIATGNNNPNNVWTEQEKDDIIACTTETKAWAKKSSDNAEQANQKLN